MTFTMWSIEHWILIASPILFAYLLQFIAKNKSYDEKRRIGVLFMVFAVILLILRNVEIWIYKDAMFHFEYLPLQICHFANFVLLYAFWKDDKTFFAFAFTLNLPAAYASLIFANVLEDDYATIITFRGIAYTLGHMLIASLTLFAYWNGFVKLSKKFMVKLFKLLFPLYVIAHLLNNIFLVFLGQRSNYFYTMSYEPNTPLQYFYELGTTYTFGTFEINPLYMMIMVFLGFAVIMTLFAVDHFLHNNKFD